MIICLKFYEIVRVRVQVPPPALVMTILASVGTVEESKIRLNIARKFNIASMIFGAVMTALVFLYIVLYVVFIVMMIGMA